MGSVEQGTVAADGEDEFGSVRECCLGDAVDTGREAAAQGRVHQDPSTTQHQMVRDVRHEGGDAVVVGAAHQGDGLEHALNLPARGKTGTALGQTYITGRRCPGRVFSGGLSSIGAS